MSRVWSRISQISWKVKVQFHGPEKCFLLMRSRRMTKEQSFFIPLWWRECFYVNKDARIYNPVLRSLRLKQQSPPRRIGLNWSCYWCSWRKPKMKWHQWRLATPKLLSGMSMHRLQYSHVDFKSHTGATMTMGGGVLCSVSTKQKVMSRSSTEAELIGVDDVISKILWSRLFTHDWF